MTKHLIVIGALFLAPALSSQAQDASGDEAIRVIRRHIDYDVGPEGKATLMVDYALSPLKRTAIDAIGQQVLSYQEGMSELEIVEAYTLKKDGRRIDVPADRIITQSAPALANAPLFTDLKVKRMVFSDLDVGDQVIYRYKRRWITPMFPGQFFDTELFPKAVRYDDVRITLKQPKDYALQIQARGLTEQAPQEKDGALLREWRYQNAVAIPEEPGAVSALDRDPIFQVTSFKSWAEIASAYNARAKDKSVVTTDVRKTADDITKGIKDKRLQAEAIYRWVAKNIRYVAVYLGAGGYVPHDAGAILTNRYGDCKDYTTLLGALLDAKGIANEPVIIEATNRFLLPEVPTPSAFNHAINYLPDFALYLDATARQLPFGILSGAESNKYVLHTRKFTDMVRTPALLQSSRRLTSISTLTVSDDGSIKGDSKISATGTMGVELGMFLDRLENPQFAKQISTVMLSLEGLTGTSEFTRTTGPDRTATGAYVSNYAIGNWINLPGPGAARLPTGLLSVSSIRMTAVQFLNSPPAKVNRICMPGVVEESSVIQLPASVKPTNVPKNMAASNPMAAYSATYERKGNTVKVTRKLESKFQTTICTPEDLNIYREILEQVRRDTSAQMTYE